MGLAVYVSLEKELPGIQGWDMGGKFLARYLEKLDRAAAKRRFTPLGDFVSVSPEEVNELLEAADRDPDALKLPPDLAEDPELAQMVRDLQGTLDAAMGQITNPPPEAWYPAADGLTTVRALTALVQERADRFRRAKELLDDLADVERILVEADKAGVRFHLSYDI
jgi:hypothetical protein